MTEPKCGAGTSIAGVGCGAQLRWESTWTEDPSAAVRCLDCRVVLCPRCAKEHFSGGERERAVAEADNLTRQALELLDDRDATIAHLTAELEAMRKERAHDKEAADLLYELLRFGVNPAMVMEGCVVNRSELSEWAREDRRRNPEHYCVCNGTGRDGGSSAPCPECLRPAPDAAEGGG